MILSTKTCQIKRYRRNPAKNPFNPRTPKTPKTSPLTHEFGRGITGQRTTKDFRKFPHQIPKSKVPETPKKTTKRGLRKSPPRTTRNNTTKP
jgi:hypothetical protein